MGNAVFLKQCYLLLIQNMLEDSYLYLMNCLQVGLVGHQGKIIQSEGSHCHPQVAVTAATVSFTSERICSDSRRYKVAQIYFTVFTQ